jgi:hypothetical protein
MHAVIAFGADVGVLDAETGESVEAARYLRTRARYDGRPIFRDRNGEPALPTRGLSYGLRESFLIQDHVDQYLAAFVEAGVAPDRSIVAEGDRTFTVANMLEASERNFRPEQELAWTLVVMSGSRRAGEAWTNAKGDEYTLEDVVGLAIRKDPREETEGGPHHLYGIAYALRERGTGEGVWLDAAAYLREYTTLVREWQRPDGAFSGGMFRQSAAPRDARQLLWSTGHTLEWLSIAPPADELKAEWVRRAVARLCATLENHPIETFSDGSLYHAAHALRLYREATR